MKASFGFQTSALRVSAFWLSLVCAVSFAQLALAQRGGRASALGGSLAPRGALTHPLGGFTSAGPGVGINRGFRNAQPRLGSRGYGYPYGYSFYVPNYFGYLDADNYSYSDPYYGNYYGATPASSWPADPGAPPSGPSQPVIINQYFGMQPPQAQQESGPQNIRDAQAPGVVSGSAQNYYLIAYKNHAVYSALAYWFEDKTLHYVTTQNTHNQASLDLIDLDLTKSLNQASDVPFAVPGH